MINRVINGILVIIIGILLLMNTTGYLPWSVWDTLIQYWPLLIIGLGVQIAFSNGVPGVALALSCVSAVGHVSVPWLQTGQQ